MLTSKSQLRDTVRAKTLLLRKLTSTEWGPSASFRGAATVSRPSAPRTAAVASRPSTITRRSPRRAPSGTSKAMVGRGSDTALPGAGTAAVTAGRSTSCQTANATATISATAAIARVIMPPRREPRTCTSNLRTDPRDPSSDERLRPGHGSSAT